VTIDRHTLALVSIIGSSLDVLGSLYLAYDLLGGEHGPLRTLTRSVTYGVLFGLGFGLALGPIFGLASGVAHGLTLAWELSRAARHGPRPGFWYETAMSAIRGIGFAVGASFLLGARFGITLGVLSTVGQVVAYRLGGIRPSRAYTPSTRPSVTKFQLLAGVNRAVGYTIAGYISALVANQPGRALTLGLEAGLLIGVVTIVVGACMPLVEWTAEHMPARRMGVIGVGLIVIGFALQSVQYWVVLMDVGVR
jgi:hypothetical protein